MITPFSLAVPQSALDEVYSRVNRYPWHDMPDIGGWGYGTDTGYMKELCRYWVSEFDWRRSEDEINRYDNFMTSIDGIDIHFIHEKGSGPKLRPLLISHGWPGSVVEFLGIIEKLAHPERFGGQIEDAFDVVAPSLPGFGFSGAPARPVGPRRMAAIFNKLMTAQLGYTGYLAQGGDWGGTIANWLGYDHAASCQGIHLNILTMRLADGPQTEEEWSWQNKFDKDQALQEGYRTQQATKPQTLSYAMMDSPVGVAAWILEKFHAWSDIKANDIESVYSKDSLLANIMVYILTGSFNTAAWIYYGRREEGGRFFPEDFQRIQVPTAAALFPAEMSTWPPRSYVERIFNLQRWTHMPAGGHFAALEQPDLLVEDVRAFARETLKR
mgnify:FL=1